MTNEGWDVIMERIEKLGLHIDVGELDWMTMILDYAEQIKEARDEAEAKLAKAVRLMEVSVEVARWELDLGLRDSVIDFLAELKAEKEQTDE